MVSFTVSVGIGHLQLYLYKSDTAKIGLIPTLLNNEKLSAASKNVWVAYHFPELVCYIQYCTSRKSVSDFKNWLIKGGGTHFSCKY